MRGTTRTLLPVEATQAALDALPSSVAAVDEQGVIVAVNRAWLAFMCENGGSPETCSTGANYLEVCDHAEGLCADEGPPVAAGLRQVLSGELSRFDLEYPCHSPTQERWFVVRILPFQAAGRGWALVVHEDVSERRHAEIREADLSAEVEGAVRARTTALQDENSELDAFIGAVSHDLRAPVRHVLGFAGLLRRSLEGKLSPNEENLLHLIEGASGRMNAMIDELLGLARVSQTALQVQDVNLAQVVLRAWAHLAPETGGREIEWTHRDLPVVRGDPELLRLAFENLLSNAIKYTAGRVKARIEVGSYSAGREWVVFVRDDGAGFDPQYKDRLFQAFQRLHPERDFAGIGMGLANVRRIIERHGGRVWAEGHPGDGATFYLSFPKPE